MFYQRRQHAIFFTKMCEWKKELKGATFSQASAIISSECEKFKDSDKKVKKYNDLYKAEKYQYEETLQRYQEERMIKAEIVSLQNSCNKTGAKAGTEAGAKGKGAAWLDDREGLKKLSQFCIWKA